MTANTKGDTFSQLPEELRIQIIKLSPDLLSLRSLAHASPAMSRVLDRYPLEIMEVVLDATVPVQTRRLVGAVLKARFSCFPASLSDAQKIAKIDLPWANDKMRLFRQDQTAAAVRSLLATAENVHVWSHACLEHLIRKSMELRPSTIIETGSGSSTREILETAKSRRDYLPQYTGPPSWVEEQRIIKAFWRLQFFLELQGAGNKEGLRNYWPGHEVDVLSKSSLDDFYDVFDFEREQILTACDFFGAVASGTVNSVECTHHNAYELPTIRWIERTILRCSCAKPPSHDPNKNNASLSLETLDETSKSYHWYYVMSSIQWLDGLPPLRGFPFQPWRKYGFAIWDNERMIDLGMRDPKRKGYYGNYIRYSFRWFSVLAEEDLPSTIDTKI